MKHCALLILAFTLAAATAQARLGETVDEIAKRYGPSTSGLYPVEYIRRDYGDRQALYEKDDIKILIVYKADKSQYESLSKKDPTKYLSRSEIKAFVEANAGGSTWPNPKETPDGKLWIRQDGNALAVLTPDHKTLTVKITQGGTKGF